MQQEEMKHSMIVDFSTTIANQNQTIKKLETVVATNDCDNQVLSDLSARLNLEKIADAETIKKLNEKIQSKDKMIIKLIEENQALSDGSNTGSTIEKTLSDINTFMQEHIASDGSRKRKPE